MQFLGPSLCLSADFPSWPLCILLGLEIGFKLQALNYC